MFRFPERAASSVEWNGPRLRDVRRPLLRLVVPHHFAALTLVHPDFFVLLRVETLETNRALSPQREQLRYICRSALRC